MGRTVNNVYEKKIGGEVVIDLLWNEPLFSTTKCGGVMDGEPWDG